MHKSINNNIDSYLKQQTRNKIVFHRDEIPDISSVNLGAQIAQLIRTYSTYDKISMKVSFELDNILNKAIKHHDIYGKYLSIENLGILFEPELKINILRLLESHSQNNLLFVKWEGEIDSDNIYYLTKENGIKINLTNLSHIVL